MHSLLLQKTGLCLTFTTAVVIMFGLVGCGPDQPGFSFTAGYEAPRSGYRIEVLSRGYVEFGHDIAQTAFAVVQICPLQESGGKEVRLTLTALPGEWVTMDCPALDIRAANLNRRSTAGLLGGMFTSAGYTNMVTEELEGTARVMMNSLAGPKGVILEGQITSVRVLTTRITYGYELNRDLPSAAWIDSTEFPACNPR